MYQFPSWFPTTISFPTSPTSTSQCCPRFPLHRMSPSQSPPSLSQGRPSPDISKSSVIPPVAPSPDIGLVSTKWQYTGRWYSGVRGHTSPPPPDLLLSSPCPEVGRSTCPSCPSLAEYLPSGGPPYGGTFPRSSQYRGALPMSLIQTVGSTVPSPCRISRMSGGMLPPSLRYLTSAPSDSAPSSDFQVSLASCHLKLWAPSQGIWNPTPPPKVSHRPKRPLTCSSVPLPPPIASNSSPLLWGIFPWPVAFHWAPSMWQTCHTWDSVVGVFSPHPVSLTCPSRGGAQSLPGVHCGLSPSPSSLVFILGYINMNRHVNPKT